MNKRYSLPSFHTFCEIAKIFAASMNDYLYVIDLTNDTYFITENVLERLAFPSSEFHNVLDTFRTFIYPEDADMVIADIRAILTGKKDDHNLKYRIMGVNGYPIWINCRGHLFRTEGVIPHLIVGCINEIGNSTPVADNTSGLLGESSLQEHLRHLMPSMQDALFLRIGIDDFKIVNERHGSAYGDFVLRSVADCIHRSLDPMQYVYRIVSDEFMVLDVSDNSYEQMNRLYHRIRSEVDGLVVRENYKSVYTISAGLISMNDIEGRMSEYTAYSEAMKLSEFALSEAKNRGKNQLYTFRREDYSSFLRRRYLNSCLRQAVTDNFKGFDLNYQPIISTNDEALYAAEALLRFRLSNGELISPREFIPLLEESRLIIPVGKWVIRNALIVCRQIRETHPDFKMSINLSYIQLLRTPLFDDINYTLRELGLPPECLIVELTESGHLEFSTSVTNVWRKLKEIGVGIALDDFGTGYSNLINIGNLHPNFVKIDRSFTLKALQNSYEFDLLVHVFKMVHSLGLHLVVEGVENQEEFDHILPLNPDYIQGYYYSMPCPQKEFMKKYKCAN